MIIMCKNKSYQQVFNIFQYLTCCKPNNYINLIIIQSFFELNLAVKICIFEFDILLLFHALISQEHKKTRLKEPGLEFTF